tara:strand:+ start:15 stop:521 length:507 start_codon:yes stop_codon:yes gene_type:complete
MATERKGTGTMYAHVKDGVVDYMGSLPKKWGNVSGLHLANGDDAYLKTIGWIPLKEVNITPTHNQVFDTDVVTVEADRVILTHRVRDLTADEITQRDLNFMKDLRVERDEKLVASDWTQASDYPSHIFPLSDDKRTEWATHRQSLRDLPATVDISTWPSDFTWPTDPV